MTDVITCLGPPLSAVTCFKNFSITSVVFSKSKSKTNAVIITQQFEYNCLFTEHHNILYTSSKFTAADWLAEFVVLEVDAPLRCQHCQTDYFRCQRTFSKMLGVYPENLEELPAYCTASSPATQKNVQFKDVSIVGTHSRKVDDGQTGRASLGNFCLNVLRNVLFVTTLAMCVSLQRYFKYSYIVDAGINFNVCDVKSCT